MNIHYSPCYHSSSHHEEELLASFRRRTFNLSSSVCDVCQVNQNDFICGLSCSFDVYPLIPSRTSSRNCMCVSLSVSLTLIQSCGGSWSIHICFYGSFKRSWTNISYVHVIYRFVFSSPGSSWPQCPLIINHILWILLEITLNWVQEYQPVLVSVTQLVI